MNPLCLLFFFLTATNAFTTFPRLSITPEWETTFQNHAGHSVSDSDDVKTFYYKQTLDHFNFNPESYIKFPQRYLINSKYWGGANSRAPIFVYLGGEAPIDYSPMGVGFMIENAASFDALLVYIEHRYYGKSVPFGSWEEATKNASTMGSFNSAQAIEDYAQIIIHIKKTLRAKMSPVIVIGGSYSGMLATWFKLKYPHLAIGALASSAPLLYFDDITPQSSYYDIVGRDFREASQTCYETILKSWSEIDRIASQPNGLFILNQIFNCYPLYDSLDLKKNLVKIYANSAQYNGPPSYPVNVICDAIDGASTGSDILSKIATGIVAYWGNETCHQVNGPTFGRETYVGWHWQTCTEIVIPIGKGNDTMVQSDPFNLKLYSERCQEQFGVSPRPHWVTSHYGGHIILTLGCFIFLGQLAGYKVDLKRFGSNIIFSNGLRDPFSGGGVLDSISDNLVAVHTIKGSHCLDLLPSSKSDPKWLIQQRKKEIKIIKGWIKQYNADLRSGKAERKYSTMCSSCIVPAWVVWWVLCRLTWDMLV